MNLSAQARQQKLAKLLAVEGYEGITDLAQEALLGGRSLCHGY
jgi:hypothetical protein